MLQNAYLVAKIGADTAENEQHVAEILPKTGNYPTGPPKRPHHRRPGPHPGDLRVRAASADRAQLRCLSNFQVMTQKKKKINC